jgi:hypothetical protein
MRSRTAKLVPSLLAEVSVVGLLALTGEAQH